MFSSLRLLLLLLFTGAICNYNLFQTREENKLASANFAVSIAVLSYLYFFKAFLRPENSVN